MSDDGILLVSHLVKFLYTGDYPALVDISCVKNQSPVANDDRKLQHETILDKYGRVIARWHKQDRVIETICISTYKETNPTEADVPDYSLHVQMYALSDQYDIPALGALARAKLEATCIINWNSRSFLEIIPRVYESTLESNQGLRTVVIDHARKHSDEFMKDELFKASFHSVLAATPEFGTALLEDYMTASHSAWW